MRQKVYVLVEGPIYLNSEIHLKRFNHESIADRVTFESLIFVWIKAIKIPRQHYIFWEINKRNTFDDDQLSTKLKDHLSPSLNRT